MNIKITIPKKAFTLAEILITLAIIGVVAVLTISSLLEHYRVKRTVTLLKNTYSMLSQATNRVIQEYGEVEGWQRCSSQDSYDEKQEDGIEIC